MGTAKMPQPRYQRGKSRYLPNPAAKLHKGHSKLVLSATSKLLQHLWGAGQGGGRRAKVMTLPYCEIRAAQAPWVGDLTATGQGGGHLSECRLSATEENKPADKSLRVGSC